MVQGRVRALPAEIVAIDWGATPAKRQLCRAVRRGPRYSLEKPESIVDPTRLELAPGTLVAFDCPIGLPESYASRVGLARFREALAAFGHGEFAHFYEPASTVDELSLHRPFYPTKSAGAKREDLVRVLGDAAFGNRACDRATSAGSLFWLVGAQQVGRSAISVWRDVLAPKRDAIALWPFDGPLDMLAASGKPVVAEMYPRFLRAALGVDVSSKRDPAARREAGRAIVESARDVDLIAVRAMLLDGFGPTPAGEDAFDAVTSCLALVRLVVEDRLTEPPPEMRAVEGWILGL
jgi:hypothetical protein